MPAIIADSLMTLEAYAKARKDFRATVMAHKKKRSVPLGEHVTLLFEDELTIRYQVQEMLRVERIFDPTGIQDELDTYNPLVPDGSNLKATMLIEYGDVDARKRMLGELRGVERQVWIQAEGCAKVHAIADEDLERETDAKTSAVHFLRFELTPEMKAALCRGGQLAVGVTHPAYAFTIAALSPATRDALVADLK
jgi:Protein of unknown function (DUF3501)